MQAASAWSAFIMAKLRGAEILVRALTSAGAREIFSLSGNQIMPVYDAAIDARLRITHVRHEGAAVHMADAWGRLTGEAGIALLTAGPGHANGIGALYTALASESPLMMFSGHAPLNQQGRGAFQELRQADLAAPVAKSSLTVLSVDTIGADVAKAMRAARSGRPGPVHLSLPFDVLEAEVEDNAALVPAREDFSPPVQLLAASAADSILGALAQAHTPIILTGPQMASSRGQELRDQLGLATGVPLLCMESPRGINDPCLGAFGDVLAQADLIMLLGKQPDFTLRFAQSPSISTKCKFILIDPDPSVLQRSTLVLGSKDRLVISLIADIPAAMRSLIERAKQGVTKTGGWKREVEEAVMHRPAAWKSTASTVDGKIHPLEIGCAVQQVLNGATDPIAVADGGEFGQWMQACVAAPTRIINGPAGSIGSAIPFAMAARVARPNATVVAMLGDGTFGFHMAEFDTAVRHGLPFVAVVGNDACWNAEYQIQLRTYGKERAMGCELLGTSYEKAVVALGGHGELVTRADDLSAALQRAIKSGKPACVNVMIERLPAPTISRQAAAGGGAH